MAEQTILSCSVVLKGSRTIFELPANNPKTKENAKLTGILDKIKTVKDPRKN